jgi:hypothetical protein
MRKLPINSVARNTIWSYPQAVTPRFTGAPAIIETTRSYEPPDMTALPDGADVGVKLYGGAVKLHLDGERRRIYVARFEYVSFTSQRETRAALASLWRRLKRLDTIADVEGTIRRWYESNKSERV